MAVIFRCPSWQNPKPWPYHNPGSMHRYQPGSHPPHGRSCGTAQTKPSPRASEGGSSARSALHAEWPVYFECIAFYGGLVGISSAMLDDAVLLLFADALPSVLRRCLLAVVQKRRRTGRWPRSLVAWEECVAARAVRQLEVGVWRPR